MTDKDRNDSADSRAAGPANDGPKLGYKRKALKVDGPKGERAFGNRKPEPRDPDAPKKQSGGELSAGPLITAHTASDHVYAFDTKADAQDKTFVQALKVKTSDIEVGSASVNLQEAKGNLVLIKGGVEASVLHGELDVAQTIREWLFGKQAVASAQALQPPAASFAPLAARVGDVTSHGSPLMPGPGSPNVFIGGMPAWRAGIDVSVCPLPGSPPHGAGPTLEGEPTVLINGMPAARMGDFVLEPTGGPNVIVTGCATVSIGKPATPPQKPQTSESPSDLPWVVFDSTATGDMVHGDAQIDGSADWDLKKAKGKVEGSAKAEVELFKGELPLKVKLRIPDTDMYLGLGLNVEGSALSLGGEIGGGAALNKDGKVFKLDWGGKVDAGLAGLGAKFSVDLGR